MLGDGLLMTQDARKTLRNPILLPESHGELLAEWDYERNDVDPRVTPMSKYVKVWWLCQSGHSYDATISHRIEGTGCPYCANKRVLKGFNDLESNHPELMGEWDYNANDILPSEVVSGSSKKVHWVCSKCGHKWSTPVNRRTVQGRGCPKCGIRSAAKKQSESRTKTPEQFKSEAELRNDKVIVIGTYVNAKTRVEVQCRQCGKKYMAFPGNILNGSGCSECMAMGSRYTEGEVRAKIREVDPTITMVGKYETVNTKTLFHCGICGNEWSAVPISIYANGSGCPKCAVGKISKKNTKSHEQFVAEMSDKNPNIEVIGRYINTNNHVRVRCRTCGYEWDGHPTHMLGGTGCPKCAGNLKYTHAEFVEKMKDVNPDIEILGEYVGGKKPVLVRCKKDGYIWSPIGSSLLAGAGCIKCAGKLRKTNREFLSELSLANNLVEPLGRYVSSKTRMRFKCKRCGHVWKSTPDAVLHGGGCPACCTQKRSFFEHVLLFALRQSLGDDEVLSRDRETMGFELDVIVPSMGIAFEPGAWFYHQNHVDRDLSKVDRCSAAGIELTTLYLGYPSDEPAPFEPCVVTDNVLSVQQWPECIRMAKLLMSKHGIDHESVDWDSVRSSALSFTGKRTTEQFVEELAQVNPDIDVVGEYFSASEVIDVRCKVCGHEWSSLPNNLLNGHGCRVCNANRQAKKMAEKFVSDIATLNQDIRVVGDYAGYENRVRVKCVKCGHEWDALPQSLRNGQKCPECTNRAKMSNEEFVERLAVANPRVTLLGEYRGYSHKVAVRCNKCGKEWESRAGDLLNGKGCLECGRERSGQARRRSHDDFVARLAVTNPGVEAVGEYRYAREKMLFRCRECGHEWMATPDNILRGRGCPACRYEKAAETRRATMAMRA